MEEITGVNAKIRFDIDYPVNYIDEVPDNIFLSKRQTALTSSGMILSRTEVGVGKMANSHEWNIRRRGARSSNIWVMSVGDL